MLSLLHPGCEKYGGLRCYSVIRLDCCASSCQCTARRAGKRHNFTRLPCDPVATGSPPPLHLSDTVCWSSQRKAQLTPNRNIDAQEQQGLKALSDMDDLHYWITQMDDTASKIVKRQMCRWFYFHLHLLAVRIDYEIQSSSNALRVNSRFHGWSFFCLPSPHALNSALNTYNYIFILKKRKKEKRKHDWTKLLTSCVSLWKA